MAEEWQTAGLLLQQRLALARVLTRLRDPDAAPLVRQVLAEAERRELHGIAGEARRLLPGSSAG